MLKHGRFEDEIIPINKMIINKEFTAINDIDPPYLIKYSFPYKVASGVLYSLHRQYYSYFSLFPSLNNAHKDMEEDKILDEIIRFIIKLNKAVFVFFS